MIRRNGNVAASDAAIDGRKYATLLARTLPAIIETERRTSECFEKSNALLIKAMIISHQKRRPCSS